MTTRLDSSTTNLHTTGQGGDSKITLIGLGAAIVLSLLAVILAAVALSRPTTMPPVTVVTSGGVNNASGGGGVGGNKRTWTVAYGHDYGAYSYFDESGYIKGFSNELVRRVCELADMECLLVWDQWNNCWDSEPGQHPRPGQGIMDRWYDACSAWAKTVERSHSLSFSDGLFDSKQAVFVVKKGNPMGFNSADLNGKKIGLLDGWATDEKCLARAQDTQHRNYVLPVERILHYSTPELAVNALKDGKVDAVLNCVSCFGDYTDVEEVQMPSKITCVIQGDSMMSRKDNEFNRYFNVGLQKVKESGEYKTMCEKAMQDHGHKGDILCIKT